MFEFLTSSEALSYYFMGVFCSYHYNRGNAIREVTDKGNVFTRLFEIETVSGLIFLVYSSYRTSWWMFIPLFIGSILTFTVIDLVINYVSKDPANAIARMSNIGIWGGPALILGILLTSIIH